MLHGKSYCTQFLGWSNSFINVYLSDLDAIVLWRMLLVQELMVEIYEYYNDPGTKEMNRLLRRTIHWAGNLYRVSPILLFECLASMAFMALDILIADVNIYLKSRRVTCRLHQWRRQFSSIHDFIDTLNMFFGQMMLFFFVHEFVTLVLYLFRIISEVQANPTSSYNVIAVLRILRYFFYFIIVTTVSEKIPQRVKFIFTYIHHHVDWCNAFRLFRWKYWLVDSVGSATIQKECLHRLIEIENLRMFHFSCWRSVTIHFKFLVNCWYRL